MDKTGACTVIAAIETVARLAPGTPLLAVAPAVENMPGPHSTRPGDIVTALNGKKVDITNTDAEGRLILGDAMTYAERLGATHLVDVATLTGAVARALGHLVTGAFGQPQAWYDDGRGRGARAGERYWQLPLIDDYVPDMDSWYADLQNAGSAEGSLVKSGLFLREFVTVPWVHLDIAGTALLPQGRSRSARAARPACRTRRSSSWPWPARRAAAARLDRGAPMEPTDVVVLAVAGGVLGARRRPVRDPLAGARRGAPAGSPHRLADRAVRRRRRGRVRAAARCAFAGDPLALVVFGAWFVTLVVGLATDLDQRLLPDELTLPVIPLALLYALSGLNPLVGGAARARRRPRRVIIPAVLYLPSIPFGAGAFGMGDVKFLAGMGLMLGGERALGGTLFGLLLAGVVLLVLLVTRRIGRKSYVPFGPFLIIGALWAVLIRA